MKTVVFTSDRHNWLLQGFLHQWQKYALEPVFGNNSKDWLKVEVAGFTRPDFLSKDVTFRSIGKFEDYPVGKWSDAIIAYLKSIPDELVLILLEDYWLMRRVNRKALWDAQQFMLWNKGVIRFDVAADRVFAHGARYVGSYGCLDLCTAGPEYSLSFQASIYRRSLLLEVLQPGETPWQAEINGSGRLNKMPWVAMGSYQWPMNYMIVVNKGKLDREGQWMYPARSLSAGDWRELDDLGYTHEPEAQSEHPL